MLLSSTVRQECAKLAECVVAERRSRGEGGCAAGDCAVLALSPMLRIMSAAAAFVDVDSRPMQCPSNAQ